MTNTFDPLRPGDIVTMEFHDCQAGDKTVTGKVVRLFPESRTLFLQAESGYFPLRAGVIIGHTTPHDAAYSSMCESLGLDD